MKYILQTNRLSWAFLDQALVSGTNFLVGIILVRFLGVDEYGKFVLLWMVIQFAMSVQNALIVSPMMSISPKIKNSDRDNYFSTATVLQGLLALLMVVLALVIVAVPDSFMPDGVTNAVMLPMVSCLVFVQLQDYIRRNLFARLQAQKAFWLDVVAYGTQIPLLVLVVSNFPSFDVALLVISTAMLCSVLIGVQWLDFTGFPKIGKVQVALRHWRSSKWLLGSAVLQWLSGNYFLVVAGVILGPAVVGAIRAAQNLLGLTHILFQGLENIVPGEASRRYHEGGTESLARYIITTGAWLLMGTGLVAGVAAVFSVPLLEVIYGVADNNSVAAMIWYVPVYVLIAIGMPLRVGLRSLEHTRAIFFAYVLTAICTIATANYLANEYGVAGVMAGMLSVQIIMTVVLGVSFVSIIGKQ